MKKCVSYIFFSLILSSSFAQKERRLPKEHVIFPNTNEFYDDIVNVPFFTIPFRVLLNGTLIIPMVIDSVSDTLNFIFDTGNSSVTMDSSTAVELHFKTENPNRTYKGVGGTVPAIISRNHRLKIENHVFSNQNIYIHDYDILSTYIGLKIHGVLGLEFIKNYVIEINYDSNKVFFYQPKNYIFPKKWETLNLSFKPLTHIPVQLKEKKIKKASSLIFDTGAGLDLILSSEFVKEANFYDSNKKIIKTTGEGLGGKIDMNLTTTRRLQLGKNFYIISQLL